MKEENILLGRHLRIKWSVLATALLIAVAFSRRPGPPKPPLDAAPVCPCESLTKVSLPNTTIDSAAIDPSNGSCRVTATVTHPPAGDRVKVFIGLPMKGWNGRFRGNGGGGFSGGSANSLRGPVALGYAAGATDTGHEGGSGSFALDANGRLNWQAIQDNAYLGIHEMTVVGKALTKALYGKAPRYSYFVGGSTGGRQGLMEAQRYPNDYDGILSACPAINWHRFLPADLWPQVVMVAAKNFVSESQARCGHGRGGGGMRRFGRSHGRRHRRSHAMRLRPEGTGGRQGRRRHVHRSRRGCGAQDLGRPAGTRRNVPLARSGARHGPLCPRRHRRFAVDGKTLHHPSGLVPILFAPESPVGLDDTDAGAGLNLSGGNPSSSTARLSAQTTRILARFRDRGGKVIIYHGLADELIPAEGTIDYYKRVQQQMGGAEKTAQFARLFLAPGVDHGFRGAGPTPIGQMDAIIRWVEDGKAPDRLIAELKDQNGKIVRTRPLFPYPQVSKVQRQWKH